GGVGFNARVQVDERHVVALGGDEVVHGAPDRLTHRTGQAPVVLLRITGSPSLPASDVDIRCGEAGGTSYPKQYHGCLSCAMCEAVGGAVHDLIAAERYDVALIHLDPGVEADAA